jgi:hypothetical protein
MGKAAHHIRQTHKNELSLRMGIKKRPASRKGHRRAVVAPHAVNSDGDHRHIALRRKVARTKEKSPSLQGM